MRGGGGNGEGQNCGDGGGEMAFLKGAGKGGFAMGGSFFSFIKHKNTAF